MRELMNFPTQPQEGISILFAGDFSQLPPVKKKHCLCVKIYNLGMNG
jgi:hypothetical protein